MKFTNEDLKRLEDEIAGKPNELPVMTVTFGIDGLKALLARLEAAERYCRASEAHIETDECSHAKCGHNFICDECKEQIAARKAWRKAAGK